MALRLQNPNETDVLDVGEGTTITIKRRMTWDDEQRLASQATKLRQTMTAAGDGQAEAELDLGMLNRLYLQVNITEWNVLDSEGDGIAEITPANVGMLPPEVADFVLAEIRKRNPTRSAKEKEQAKKARSKASTTG